MAEDPEFTEDYMAGRYDRTCDMCGGSGKVKTQDVVKWQRHRADKYQEWVESGCPEGSFDKWAGL